MQFNLEQYCDDNTDKFRKLQEEVQALFKGVMDLYTIKGRIKSYAKVKGIPLYICHYTVKLKGYEDLCCEIQVRSLFEEAWCEIDHLANYPEKNGNRLCRDSLKELASLVHKSNKLADTILREASS